MKNTDTYYLTEKQLEQIRNAKRKKPIGVIVVGLLFVVSTLCGILASFTEGDLSVILNGIMGIGTIASLIIALIPNNNTPTITDSERKEISTEEIGRDSLINR